MRTPSFSLNIQVAGYLMLQVPNLPSNSSWLMFTRFFLFLYRREQTLQLIQSSLNGAFSARRLVNVAIGRRPLQLVHTRRVLGAGLLGRTLGLLMGEVGSGVRPEAFCCLAAVVVPEGVEDTAEVPIWLLPSYRGVVCRMTPRVFCALPISATPAATPGCPL